MSSLRVGDHIRDFRGYYLGSIYTVLPSAVILNSGLQLSLFLRNRLWIRSFRLPKANEEKALYQLHILSSNKLDTRIKKVNSPLSREENTVSRRKRTEKDLRRCKRRRRPGQRRRLHMVREPMPLIFTRLRSQIPYGVFIYIEWPKIPHLTTVITDRTEYTILGITCNSFFKEHIVIPLLKVERRRKVRQGTHQLRIRRDMGTCDLSNRIELSKPLLPEMVVIQIPPVLYEAIQTMSCQIPLQIYHQNYSGLDSVLHPHKTLDEQGVTQKYNRLFIYNCSTLLHLPYWEDENGNNLQGSLEVYIQVWHLKKIHVNTIRLSVNPYMTVRYLINFILCYYRAVFGNYFNKDPGIGLQPRNATNYPIK